MRLKDNLNDVRLYIFNATSNISFSKDRRGHHINGPSLVQSNGCKQYQINGLYHNAKGPSHVWSDGKKVYYLSGNYLSEKEWRYETNR